MAEYAVIFGSLPVLASRSLFRFGTIRRARRSMLAVLSVVMPCAALAQEPPAPAERVLRSIRDIRRLSREEAAEAIPVQVTGVVTHFERGWRRLFVQDDTGGVYVGVNADGEPAALRSGVRVEVRGVTTPGRFAPNVQGPGGSSAAVSVLGDGEWPLPAKLSADQMLLPSYHCQWVQIPCVLHESRKYQGQRRFTGSAAGHRFELLVAGEPAPRDDEYLFRELVVQGVYVALYDEASRQTGFEIYTPRKGLLLRLDRRARGVFDAPQRLSPELLRHSGDGPGIVRLSGRATLVLPGVGLYLRDDGGAVWVGTQQRTAWQSGDLVTVAGRATGGKHRAFLHDAAVRVEPGPRALPPPLDLAAGAAAPRLDGERVAIEGRVVDVSLRENRPVLLVEAGGQTFTAESAHADAPALPQPQPLSLVSITGVLRVVGESGSAFQLLCEGADAVRLLRAPPWWRAAWVPWGAGGLVAFSLGIVGWNFALRRRVLQQTALIERKVEFERVAAERERIAQDLHDSLQQELAGLGLQIQNAESALPPGLAPAAEALALARTTLRHTQAEVRRTVWDLGPAELAGCALGDAIRSRLASTPVEGGAQVAFATSGEPRRFPRGVELALLRIAQEAVGNALQHARAAQVQVALDYDAHGGRLTVRDDGAGFDPAACLAGPPAQSFGLRSMRRRARYIGADFDCLSAPGAGTTITAAWRETPAASST
jgi:signal transduction histidine kinase